MPIKLGGLNWKICCPVCWPNLLIYGGENEAQRGFHTILMVKSKDWTQNFQLIHQFTLHSNTHHVCKALFPAHSFTYWPREHFRQAFPVLAGIGVQCVLWGSLLDFLRESTYAQAPDNCAFTLTAVRQTRKSCPQKNNQHLQKCSGVASGSVPGKLLL